MVKFDFWPFSLGRSFWSPINILKHHKFSQKPLAHLNSNFKWRFLLNAKYFGHMTKMAATPIYGKNILNRLRNQKINDLGTWYVAFGVWGLPNMLKWWYEVVVDLLNVSWGQICFLMQLNGNNFEKLIFWKLMKPKSLFSLDMFNLMRQWL